MKKKLVPFNQPFETSENIGKNSFQYIKYSNSSLVELNRLILTIYRSNLKLVHSNFC